MTKASNAPRLPSAPTSTYAEAQIAPLDIAGMLRVLWHGKLLIILAILCFTALAGTYAFRILPPQYQATAAAELHPGDMTLKTQGFPHIDATSLNTTIALATSEQVLAATVNRLDLLSDPEFNRYLQPSSPWSLRAIRTNLRHFLAGTTEQPPDRSDIQVKTVQNLRAALQVTRLPDSYILQVTARSGDPAKSRRIADTVAAQFLRADSTRRVAMWADAETWLQERVSSLRAQLETQQMQAAALIATAQLQGGSGLNTLSADILAAEQALTTARSARETLQSAPDHASPRNAAQVAQLQDEINELAAHKTQISAQLAAQSAGQAQLQQIELQIAATRQLYQGFLAQLHDLRMRQSLARPDVERLTPAAKALYIGPQKILILTIAALLGGVLGVLLVTFAHMTRQGAIDAQSLRAATGLPVLSQVSRQALRKMQGKPLKRALADHAALVQASCGLQTALALTSGTAPPKVQVFTATLQGEGRTHMALLSAHGLALSGKRVVVILADRASTRPYPDITKTLLAAAEDSWQTGEAPPLLPGIGASLLVWPKAMPDRAPLLPDQLATKLHALQSHFDHIIVIAPPALRGVEAQLLTQNADVVVYAVRWARTPLVLVQRGLDVLAEGQVAPAGLVLTHIDRRKMRKLSDDPYINTMQSAQVI